MSLFNYKATDSNNKITTGTITAPTKEEVAQILSKRGLNPVIIKPSPSKKNVSGTLPDVEKIAFCRYVGTMLMSGLSLTEGIPSLKSETKNPLMRQILDDITYHLERGQPLSHALSAYPKTFSPFFLTLVKSGEVSGTLGDSFKYLERQLRAEYSLTQKIKSAMVYPSIVFVIMIGMGFLMFFFILPQIGQVFLNMRIPLPFFTNTLFTSAIAAAKFRYPLIAGTVVVMLGLFLYLKKPSGKKMVLKIIAPIPVVSNLLKQIDVARFCRIFSTLVASAVPINDALDIALSSLSHPQFTSIQKNITQKVIQGASITQAFGEKPVFPALLIQMINAGEKTGTMDTSLADLATFYEEEVEEAVKKTTQLLEPLVMLLVGIGVGGIILSIIGPLYSVIGNLQTTG